MCQYDGLRNPVDTTSRQNLDGRGAVLCVSSLSRLLFSRVRCRNMLFSYRATPASGADAIGNQAILITFGVVLSGCESSRVALASSMGLNRLRK